MLGSIRVPEFLFTDEATHVRSKVGSAADNAGFEY